MQLMSETFHISLETMDGLGDMKYRKSNKQRGKLNEEWNYFFHGSGCRFENAMTGQIVEITITTYPEFGTLNGYFFYQYMATTDSFKTLAMQLGNDYHNVFSAIDLFVEEGDLATFDHFGQRMVVAR